MRTPFPGMDPYLENPDFWPGFHNGLLAALCEWLGPRLRPRYYAALEQRVYAFGREEFMLIGVPDISVLSPSRQRGAAPGPRQRGAACVLEVEVPVSHEVREVFIEVHDTSTQDLVTVIELLSPANKVHSTGRTDYLKKRTTLFASRTSLVEVDLMRGGKPMPLRRRAPPSDYRILVSRGSEHPHALLHVLGVRDSIPRFHLPLLPDDDEPELDLGALVHDHYERVSFDLRIDYDQPAIPPLGPKDAEWARKLIKAGGRAPPLAARRAGAARVRRRVAAKAARRSARRTTRRAAGR